MISDIFGIIFQAVVLNHILIEHLSILASSWPAHNGRRVVDIAQSTYNHYVDEAEKRIKEIRDQADKIDSLKDEFDDFLESTKNEIVETKEVMEKEPMKLKRQQMQGIRRWVNNMKIFLCLLKKMLRNR